MCIYFIHNLLKKAKSHHLIALLPHFTLCSVFILDVTNLLEIQRGGSLIDDLENDQFYTKSASIIICK